LLNFIFFIIVIVIIIAIIAIIVTFDAATITDRTSDGVWTEGYLSLAIVNWILVSFLIFVNFTYIQDKTLLAHIVLTKARASKFIFDAYFDYKELILVEIIPQEDMERSNNMFYFADNCITQFTFPKFLRTTALKNCNIIKIKIRCSSEQVDFSYNFMANFDDLSIKLGNETQIKQDSKFVESLIDVTLFFSSKILRQFHFEFTATTRVNIAVLAKNADNIGNDENLLLDRVNSIYDIKGLSYGELKDEANESKEHDNYFSVYPRSSGSSSSSASSSTSASSSATSKLDH